MYPKLFVSKLLIPNFNYKNTVYLILNTPIYCIPKSLGQPWQTHWSINLIHISTVLVIYHRSIDLQIYWSIHLQIHRSSDRPQIHRSTNLLIHWSTVLAIYHRSIDLQIYWSINLLIHRFSDLPQIHRSTDLFTTDPPIYHRSTILAIYHRSTVLAIYHISTDLPQLHRSSKLPQINQSTTAPPF